MVRTIIAAVALMALATVATAPASAYAAPGDYARNSQVYSGFIASCQAANNDPPAIRDEAARKLEHMYRTNRSQYDLQIKGCQMSLPKPEVQRQRQASSVPPPEPLDDEDAEVGTTVGRTAMRPNGQPYGDGRRPTRLSPEQEGQLQELLDRKSEQLLGARDRNSIGFQPSTGRSAIHCRGGRILKSVDADRGVFSRVFCPGPKPAQY